MVHIDPEQCMGHPGIRSKQTKGDGSGFPHMHGSLDARDKSPRQLSVVVCLGIASSGSVHR